VKQCRDRPISFLHPEQSAAAQPFLSQLANSGALLSQYNGISHPSEPNYLALTSGSDWGIHDDFRHTINATHLGDLLDAKGYSWKSYAEDYPGQCDLRAQVGNYVRKHELSHSIWVAEDFELLL
jgi:hypothetical protein